MVSPAPHRSSIRLILADRAVATLIGLALLVMLGVGLVLPILPLYARSFDVGYAGVGIIVGAYALTRLVTDIVGGPVIDRVGERIVAAAGLLVVACSALLTGLAPAYALAVLFWGYAVCSAVTVQEVSHRKFQAVDADGEQTYTGSDKVVLEGVVLNYPADMLDPTPDDGVGEMFNPYHGYS